MIFNNSSCTFLSKRGIELSPHREDPEFVRKIKKFEKKESEILEIMKNPSNECWDDRLELETELSELQGALFYENRF